MNHDNTYTVRGMRCANFLIDKGFHICHLDRDINNRAYNIYVFKIEDGFSDAMKDFNAMLKG